FLALLLVVSLLQRGLEFLDPLIEVVLSLRQFLQPAQHLELLPLLGVLLRRSLALRFVTVFGRLQFQLIELPLRAFTAPLAALLAATPRHLILARSQFQQRLISRLLGPQRRHERRRGAFARRFAQVIHRLFHLRLDCSDQGLASRVVHGLFYRARLFEGLLLGLLDNPHILLVV